MKTRFLLSNNPQKLIEALTAKAGLRTATVEAEYGDTTVLGTEITMAHHGDNKGRPAPCSYANGCVENIHLVGLSHVDLDSLGGCAAIIRVKPHAPGFWQLAEYVDLNGLHKLGQSGASEADIKRLFAFLAWDKNKKVRPSKNGEVTDVTGEIMEGIVFLTAILEDNGPLLEAGQRFVEELKKLNETSFIDIEDGVILRVSDRFVSHLYTTPDGQVADAIVAFNTTEGTITVSFAEVVKGKSASDIVRKLFGPGAGGHEGIAGSPRNQRMKASDIMATLTETKAVVSRTAS